MKRILQALVGASLLCAPLAHAELVRIEVGAPTGQGVPESFDEFRERLHRSGLTVQYSDDPVFDPYYSTYGGATYGSIAVDTGTGDSVTATWVQFDDAAAASQQELELNATYGAGGYLGFARSGRVLVQTYSHMGVPETAARVLAMILGG